MSKMFWIEWEIPFIMIHLMFSGISLAKAYRASAVCYFIKIKLSSSDSSWMSKLCMRVEIQFISPNKNEADFDFEAI